MATCITEIASDWYGSIYNIKTMNTYETIDQNDYVQTGEGGTALTYTHVTRPTMAKLFNPGNEAELAEKEFLTARAVFEMGIPTPEPLRLVTDGQRRGVEYELIRNKRSFTRIISQEPERLEEPHYVNRHEDSVQHCCNCGTEFADNFCPRCGQRAEVGRVGWNSVKENVALLWGMDSRSLTYTLDQLLGRPGYLVRDYISGRRLVCRMLS